MKSSSANACPCGTSRPYSSCCKRWIEGDPAPDAESLMRSRYSAYVLGLTDYLMATWHPSSRPDSLELHDNHTWLGLSVKRHRVLDADHAEVEFVARFRHGGGPASRLHERSRFIREDGRWLYLDGQIDPGP